MKKNPRFIKKIYDNWTVYVDMGDNSALPIWVGSKYKDAVEHLRYHNEYRTVAWDRDDAEFNWWTSQYRIKFKNGKLKLPNRFLSYIKDESISRLLPIFIAVVVGALGLSVGISDSTWVPVLLGAFALGVGTFLLLAFYALYRKTLRMSGL